MGAGWGRGAAPRRKQIVASGSGRSGLLLMRKTLASFQLVALPSSNLAHNQDKRWLIIKYLVGFPWPVAVIDCPPVICITSRDFGFGYSDLVSDSVDYCVSLGTWPTFLLIRVDSLHNVINWILGQAGARKPRLATAWLSTIPCLPGHLVTCWPASCSQGLRFPRHMIPSFADWRLCSPAYEIRF